MEGCDEMAHKHSIYDTDSHFVVNAITRGMTNASSQKTVLVQHDHNSERFTFEIPRYIEEHDMLNCNKVEVHYLNIDSSTREQNEGVYIVDDLQLSPEDENIVICSWLISCNATQLVGALNFVIRFACMTDTVVDYAWNTAPFTGISVSNGIFNTEIVAETYADVLDEWYNTLIGAGDSSIQRINEATNRSISLIGQTGGTLVSPTEPQHKDVDVWVKTSHEENEINILTDEDIAQELSDATDKVPSVALLKQIAEQGGGSADLEGLEEALDRIIEIQEGLIGVKEITFTIKVGGDPLTYKALEGMTWGEWCNSKYNTLGLYVEAESISHYDEGIALSTNLLDLDLGSLPVESDLVIANGNYMLG